MHAAFAAQATPMVHMKTNAEENIRFWSMAAVLPLRSLPLLYQQKTATAKQAPIVRSTCLGKQPLLRKGSPHEGHARHVDDHQHRLDRLWRVDGGHVPDDVRQRRRREALMGDILESLDFPRRRRALRVLALALFVAEMAAHRARRVRRPDHLDELPRGGALCLLLAHCAHRNVLERNSTPRRTAR